MVGPSPLLPTMLGHYRILEEIGQGGMGRVYRAHDEHLDRDVAIKVLQSGATCDESARKRFRKEALSLSKLNHPNIATIYDLGCESGVDFLVMEYIPGETLNRRIGAGPMAEKEIARLGAQLADGLQAAHREGIIHRDLKPANVRITSDGRLKILDFGLAWLMQQHPPTGLTETETTTITNLGPAGTLPYMAPEQLRNEKMDGRTDLWAAGAVLYEMSTGSPPFPQAGLRLVDDILHAAVTPPTLLNRRISPHFENVVLKCLEKDPDNRYQSATELAVDLRRLSAADVIPMPGSGAPAYRPKRRFGWKLAGFALAVLLVLSVPIALNIASVRQWWLARYGHPAPGPVAGSRTIVVLPFNASQESESTRAFSDGLAESTAAKLTQLSARFPLQVISPTEARDQGVTTAEQARQLLGVDLVVTGTLRGAGNAVRVNYRLVDARTSRELRGDTVTAESSNPFSMEDQVVESVLQGLEIVLAPDERQALTAHRTTEPRAQDFYLQGRGYLLDYHKPENVQSAIEVFQQALTRDPTYAQAYAGLGQAYIYRYELVKDAQLLDKARNACERAVQLDSASAGQTCLGVVYYETGKYGDAVQQLQRAIEAEPTNDEAYRWLAKAYEGKEDIAQAEATFKRAVALRPNYWGGYSMLGAFYFRKSRFNDALAQFKQAISLAPDNFRLYSNLGGVCLAMGEYEKAISYLEKSNSLHPTAEALSNLGVAYFYLKRYGDAANAYERATRISPNEQLIWGNLGEAYYWMPGKRAECQRALTQALRLVNKDLRVNPRDLDALRYGAGYYAMLGDQQKAQEYLHKGLDIAPNDSEMLFKASVVSVLAGQTKEGLDWLRKALAAGYGNERVLDDPAFGTLRGDPEFQAILRGK